MPNLIILQEAINEIKKSIEIAIKSSGSSGKNNLIRSQKPIKLLHEVVKSELIFNNVNGDLISPKLTESRGELGLAGFFKKKNQDVSIVSNDVEKNEELLTFQGILYGKKDIFGFIYKKKKIHLN